MEFPESTRRARFRQLVGLVIISLGYDLAWFFINRDVEEDDSGGLEYNIKRFSRIISWISFGFRIILALILLKASLDFLTIVKGKKVDKNLDSLENKVQSIIEEHEKNYIREDYSMEQSGYDIPRR